MDDDVKHCTPMTLPTDTPLYSCSSYIASRAPFDHTLFTAPTEQTACRGEEERLQLQTSRYHGVRQNKRSEKWESYIRVAGKHLHLGCHDNEVAAAQAFDQAVMLRHVYCSEGDNNVPLVTNFPPEYYQVRTQPAGLAPCKS